MNSKWMTWSMAVSLGLAAIAATVGAQERPAPAPREAIAGEANGIDDLEDLGGLDLLLAAEVPPGPGGGPGAHGAGGPMGQGMHRGPGMGAGGPAGELREKLNLTDDQKSKLADIHDRRLRAAIPIDGDLRIAALDLHKLMRADKPDSRAIDAQIDRIAALRASMQKSRVAGMLEARTVLTPAQQKMMREHHGAMMGRPMHGGRGMRGGPGMRGDPGMGGTHL